MISIRKIFFNLKTALLLLAGGTVLLAVQIFHISEYSERLSAMKNQHLLIEKIINTDLSDPKMASILINGAIYELELSVKLSGEISFLDSITSSSQEQDSLLRSLQISSETFRDNALLWSEALAISKISSKERMMKARTAYLGDIDRMIDFQIHGIQESISSAKMTAAALVIFTLFLYLLYRYRLNQIYTDIKQVCSVETDASSKLITTQEIDFALKRMRKTPSAPFNPGLLHPLSGLNNEKGLNSAFSARKANRSGNAVFLCLFEIDNYRSLSSSLSKEEMGNIFKKLGEIISMYEQSTDVIGHMDDDRLIFLMSRSTKNGAFNECEKIIHSVEESSFSTSQDILKLTLSAGFLLKPPAKSIEEAAREALLLVERSQSNGGNQISQIRERATR